MLELERIGSADYVARRQVIHWKPDFWVVLDSTSGRDQSYTRSTWTTASDVRWDPGTPMAPSSSEGRTPTNI